MKILALDIETAPNLAHVWGIWQQNVGLSQIMEEGYILCWAAKWIGSDEIMFDSLENSTKRDMLVRMHALMSQADAVVTYNGDNFDLPFLNAEFASLGMTPPPPYKSVDLLKVVKNKFRLPSNKLEFVVEYFGVGEKMKNSGHELWIKVMQNEPQAWKEMELYNKHDVYLLDALFLTIRPWIKGVLPPTGEHTCRNCGSDHVQRRGSAVTSVGVYQRYQCLDCGSWSRGGTNSLTLAERKNVLRPL